MSTVARDRLDTTTIDAPPGLAGVVVAPTAIGDVRGLEGYFHYRGYSAVELASRTSVEEVWHLLVDGELPTAAELAAFSADVRRRRQLPPQIARLLPGLAEAARGGDPLAGLRAALSVVGAELGLRPLYDSDPAERRDAVLTLGALTPVLLAELSRRQRGLAVVTPDDGAGFVADYLWRVTGAEPDARHVTALSTYLVATVDHGFNASTFTARVIASTGADPAACLVGALGSLSGPLHGGAPSRVLDALDEIAHARRAREWARDQISAGRRVMGFGHPVYRTEDPRSAMLREVVLDLGAPRAELAVAVEREVLAALEELKPGRALHTNVEFYASVLLEACGIPREAFTATFATARTIGWSAHVLEQAADPKIIRPSARYVGPTPPRPLP
ncbi:Citrate (Si)-synthase [Beutenbergia cavernae DSM 12333]|uniref:Citrate synthase n=1 Tax=Beutenbergia cavernae (strain ATCC BAA-8 / DSM 12333 / CCUG 43141 / JCM 11478 / NBRC 16432 / NCIMB 13614 / HKI 0122) TaxID=471853 RepID=C5C3T1_BEUC1|nr:citrate synthase [Beutenbergia cavernae]ACQ81990.1 Citrate (Si)-synthase [Beutenbergia cavernae DSM 12333]